MCGAGKAHYRTVSNIKVTTEPPIMSLPAFLGPLWSSVPLISGAVRCSLGRITLAPRRSARECHPPYGPGEHAGACLGTAPVAA
ncbi:hypothetical protein SKAU_G00248200 [Synaphobranchus kaupii]|uniref:Uncharacterized protein n=1 Tax=Synaphobranchus kaupii TaxID=118154 RepID=A0A9Q1F2J8_SYNKA|nr:hypothetical protein SKAU_G00248200 [Synaphobranchus kaupii]